MRSASPRDGVLKALTLKLLALLIATVAALVAGAYAEVPYLMDAGALLFIAALLLLFVFTQVGIPGLLEHAGNCGWGICGPTPWGLAFLAAVVLGILWLLARGAAAIIEATAVGRAFTRRDEKP
jgi:hypothetical protein